MKNSIGIQGVVLLLLIFAAMHLAAFLSKDFSILWLFYFLFTSCAIISVFVERREARRLKRKF